MLKPTYGVILYQEQVMQIARTLGGYTLGSADLLRRAMGKKKREEMAQQRDVFVKGAEANQVSKTVAASIFDLMEKFAGYGFNKSHSVALRLARLPDCLAEDPLSRGIHGGSAVRGHEQHGPDRQADRRTGKDEAGIEAAVDQSRPISSSG